MFVKSCCVYMQMTDALEFSNEGKPVKAFIVLYSQNCPNEQCSRSESHFRRHRQSHALSIPSRNGTKIRLSHFKTNVHFVHPLTLKGRLLPNVL